MFVSEVFPWYELPVPSKQTTILDMFAMKLKMKRSWREDGEKMERRWREERRKKYKPNTSQIQAKSQEVVRTDNLTVLGRYNLTGCTLPGVAAPCLEDYHVKSTLSTLEITFRNIKCSNMSVRNILQESNHFLVPRLFS